ncbi:hypothetical protein DB88DRAFT_501821 [Papiliotrema laurentii]|uniref:Uncharacterized protein n=1 Tax=Papiliotrema laurentii TaxID=5418 RepID=A0AAD9FMK0_PAPLA|nr:hypothetical protein DB88DRAFT_501821 [Papiliotrema laurentii]
MSSLPPRRPTVDPHNLTTAQNLKQATQSVNRFAKRDPALYPLSAVVVGALAVAGYFFTKKSTQPDAARQLMRHGVVNPWDDESKHDTGGAVANFKYRYRTREGHYEDHAPALNTEVRTLKNAAKHKFSAN